MRHRLLRTSLLVAILAVPGVALATPASAATPCQVDCTVTIKAQQKLTPVPGVADTQQAWTVPSDALDVRVTVAGGAGGPTAFINSAPPVRNSFGGTVTVDLGTTYNGKTLHAVAGARGRALTYIAVNGFESIGGRGSFVAAPGKLLVAAGGGGGTGRTRVTPAGTDVDASEQVITTGGNAGFSTRSADGQTGQDYPGVHAAGTGAQGAKAGVAGTRPDLVKAGRNGTVTTVDAEGVITPGIGGRGAFVQGGPGAGAGGGGYAGGGGGSFATSTDGVYSGIGPGGGGSGYLASGLRATSTAPNTGPGFVTFTYTLKPTITTPATTIQPGSTATLTVTGLAPGAQFSVRLSPSGNTLAQGTANSAGTATVTVTVPSDAPAGTSHLELVVDGAVQAVTDPFTVIAATPAETPATGPTLATSGTELADTGSDVPPGVIPGVLLAVAIGAALIAFGRKRRTY